MNYTHSGIVPKSAAYAILGISALFYLLLESLLVYVQIGYQAKVELSFMDAASFTVLGTCFVVSLSFVFYWQAPEEPYGLFGNCDVTDPSCALFAIVIILVIYFAIITFLCILGVIVYRHHAESLRRLDTNASE